MARRLFDLPGIQATEVLPGSPHLSAQSRALILSALSVMTELWRWNTTNDLDEVDAAVSLAILEVQQNMLIGSVIWVAGDTPDGTLYCDGATYGRVDYPNLYAALDAAYIIDADNFKVPDLRGAFPLGSGSGYSIGDTGGEAMHTLSGSEMPIHSHTQPPHTHTEIIAVAALINGGLEAPAAAAVPGGGVTGTASPTTNTTGGGQAHNNLPPFEVLRPCLVAQ